MSSSKKRLNLDPTAKFEKVMNFEVDFEAEFEALRVSQSSMKDPGTSTRYRKPGVQ